MDDMLTLVSYVQTQDEYGVIHESTPVEREVFCRVASVSRNEYFGGGRNGLNPEFEFTIAKIDYKGERECVYHGQSYSIYRTYMTDDDYIELYVERKGGTNGEADITGTPVC